MLNRVEMVGPMPTQEHLDWNALSEFERHLVGHYRMLDNKDQKKLRRFADLLLVVPEEPTHNG